MPNISSCQFSPGIVNLGCCFVVVVRPTDAKSARAAGALLAERQKGEIGTSQSKHGTSVNFSNGGKILLTSRVLLTSRDARMLRRCLRRRMAPIPEQMAPVPDRLEPLKRRCLTARGCVQNIKRICIELMTSDRKLKTSREGSK